MKRSYLIAAALVAALTGVVVGCNLTGGIDNPDSIEEILNRAQAMMDRGDCGEAVSELRNVTADDDRRHRLLGWAQLCVAGAPFSKVANTLLTYSSNANNLRVVGNLADRMIPTTDLQITTINDAINSFQRMRDASNARDRSVNIALGYVIKSAALLATTTGNATRVLRADISGTTCLNTACTAGNATCTAASSRIGDSVANQIGSALVDAATAVGSDSSLGAARDLAQRLGAAASATVANMNRCNIYNQMLAE